MLIKRDIDIKNNNNNIKHQFLTDWIYFVLSEP